MRAPCKYVIWYIPIIAIKNPSVTTYVSAQSLYSLGIQCTSSKIRILNKHQNYLLPVARRRSVIWYMIWSERKLQSYYYSLVQPDFIVYATQLWSEIACSWTRKLWEMLCQKVLKKVKCISEINGIVFLCIFKKKE